MRICKCGGKIETSEMTNGADRWKCKDCGRYELFEKLKEPMKPEIIQAILGGEHKES